MTLVTALPASAYELVTPPPDGQPLPTGHPFFIAGSVAQGVISLRFAIVNGRRVLVDARTLQPVYILQP
jgi:hypothetical protein